MHNSVSANKQFVGAGREAATTESKSRNGRNNCR